MKTLIIISHPSIADSSSQQFLLNAVAGYEQVTTHHLESNYRDGQIDVLKERELLKAYDRILFQFPFYWYSSPALLKEWQDKVLISQDFQQQDESQLAGKEFGLVITIGNQQAAYQAGGREGFSVAELTRPYQALANHFGMTYRPSFTIHQFGYLTEAEKMIQLVAYQYYVTGLNNSSFEQRTDWMLKELGQTSLSTLEQGSAEKLAHITAGIKERQAYLLDLNETLAAL